MLMLPPVRLASEDWVRLMRLAFNPESNLDPVSAFLRAEVHRAIVVTHADADVVQLNAWVSYRVDWGPTERRLLVHPENYLPDGYHLSVFSSVGAALIGIRIGDRMPFLEEGRSLHVVTPMSLRREPTAPGLPRPKMVE